MTISDKIFELMKEKEISQRAFSERTGIAETTISEWKRRRTNPSSDKLLIISQVLDVPVEELLSGTSSIGNGTRSRRDTTYIVLEGTDLWLSVESFQSMNQDMQKRVLRYMEALKQRKAERESCREKTQS